MPFIVDNHHGFNKSGCCVRSNPNLSVSFYHKSEILPLLQRDSLTGIFIVWGKASWVGAFCDWPRRTRLFERVYSFTRIRIGIVHEVHGCSCALRRRDGSISDRLRFFQFLSFLTSPVLNLRFVLNIYVLFYRKFRHIKWMISTQCKTAPSLCSFRTSSISATRIVAKAR